jgi:hypothetical protein
MVYFIFKLTILLAKCFVGVKILTPVVMKRAIFWDITPCNPSKVSRRFGATYCLHLQGSCSAYSTLRVEAICSFEM